MATLGLRGVDFLLLVIWLFVLLYEHTCILVYLATLIKNKQHQSFFQHLNA